MCGRFGLWADPDLVTTHFQLPRSLPLIPRYNIAPSQEILAIGQSKNRERKANMLRWGLVPHWAKDTNIGYKMINARAESIWTKPAYRVAARKQRCLIPASCFFEWQKKGENSKQPYCIRPKDNTLFSFAGIWETWREKDTGKTIFSCAIITTRANTALQNLHDRMPVIVTEKDYDLWLDRSEQPPEKLQHLLEPISSEHLAIYAVSQTINTPANDSAELIDPIDED